MPLPLKTIVCRISLKRMYDFCVRPVYSARVKCGEVNACGHFRIMPHAFADYADRNPFKFGNRCPGVTCHVKCEGHRYIQTPSYRFEIPVYKIAYPAVFIPRLDIGPPDNRQEIIGAAFRVFIHDLLHFACPFIFRI